MCVKLTFYNSRQPKDDRDGKIRKAFINNLYARFYFVTVLVISSFWVMSFGRSEPEFYGPFVLSFFNLSENLEKYLRSFALGAQVVLWAHFCFHNIKRKSGFESLVYYSSIVDSRSLRPFFNLHFA